MARKTSFYYAFLVLPRPQREAMIAVWDFCRAVDDEVDEPPAAVDRLPADQRQAAIRAALNRWRADPSGSGPPFFRTGGTLVRYSRDDVRRWLESRRRTSTAPDSGIVFGSGR